jgi:lipoic acid synthetase
MRCSFARRRTRYSNLKLTTGKIDRWVTPEEFKHWKDFCLSIGFGVVESGPLVRSSYHADEQSSKYTDEEHLNTTNTFASA